MYIDELIEKVMEQNYNTTLLDDIVTIKSISNASDMKCRIKSICIYGEKLNIELKTNDRPVYDLSSMINICDNPAEVLYSCYDVPRSINNKKIEYIIYPGMFSLEILIKINV